MFSKNKLLMAMAAATFGMTVNAAEPSLPAAAANGSATTATFSGGATADGITFANSFSASTAFDVVGTINVASADVGKMGSMAVVVDVPNMGLYQMLSGGFFVPWSGNPAELRPFMQKPLPAQQRVTVFDDLVGQYSNLQGLSFNVFMGYYAGTDVNNIVFTPSPLNFSIQSGTVNQPDAPCPATSTQSNTQFENKTVCVLTGTITADTHLTANNVYLLDGAVFVGGDNQNSATLSIDAGTKVISPVGLNFLVINRGSKIEANGTSAAPIIFTYDDEANATASTTGRWGGIIINGNAPVSGCAAGTALCELEGEGSTGLYGGNNPADSSGFMNYVIVKYPGQNITETNELNGIALQGVGSGTVLTNIQVHGSSDDGIEFFGGRASVKNLVLTSNEDDSFDWTFGWQGKVQHAIIVQREGNGDRGIEADSNEFDFDAEPRAKPTLANFTFIGKGASGRGLELRRGTGANISNFVVTNFDNYCLDINDNATFLNGGSSATNLTGELTMTNTVLDCEVNFSESAEEPWSVSAWFNAQPGNATGSADLTGYINGPMLNARPAATFTDTFFDQVDHIGAVPSAQADWASAWIYQD